MDLPTYTNIWRIEKRLYKLYDFRLPAPLPITWIGVFVGITVPYVLFLIAVGLPFNHNLVWLYILPPGVLTWLTTRPVIESKRLPELVSSQLRYVAEPRTWCRMAPFAEKDEILVTARVWHQHPPKARPKKAKKAVVKATSGASAPQLAAPGAEEMAHAEVRPVKARWAAARSLAARQTAPPPACPPVTGRVTGLVTGSRAGCPAVARAGTGTGAGAGTRAGPPGSQARQAGAGDAAVVVSVAARAGTGHRERPGRRPGARSGSAPRVGHPATSGRDARGQDARGRPRLRSRFPRPGRAAGVLRSGILAVARGQPAPAGPPAPRAGSVPGSRPVPRRGPVPGSRPVPRG